MSTTLSIPNMRAIAFDASDELYGATTNGRLYRVNPANGDTTYIGSSGLIYSGLSFNPITGDLWASVRPPLTNRDKIYRVDKQTGLATLVGATGDNLITPSIAFNPLGILYGLKGTGSQVNTLIDIDTTTAAGTAVSSTGATNLFAITMRTDSLTTGVSENGIPAAPVAYALHQNYPNPFNPTTRISYDLPVSGKVKLIVFDVVGRQIATLVDDEQQAGFKSVEFRSNRFASGVYFYQLSSGTFVATKKMVVIK